MTEATGYLNQQPGSSGSNQDHGAKTRALGWKPGTRESRLFKAFTIQYAFPHWKFYFFGTLTLACVNLITLAIPQLAKDIVNNIEQGAVSDSAQLALGIIGLGVGMMIIRSLSRILIFWPGRKLETEIKSDLFSHVMDLPLQALHRFGLGDLISRLANDVGHIRVFFAFGLLQILNLGFLTVFTVSKMASVHPTLTVAALSPLLLMLLITSYAMPRMHRASKENQEAIGRLTNRITEAFIHINVIQANASEHNFAQMADKENEDVYRTNMQLVFVRTVLFPLMSCLSGFSQLVILFYGGTLVINNALTVGDILAFNIYIGLLTFPLIALGIILSVYQRAKTALVRAGEVFALETEDLPPREPAPTTSPTKTRSANQSSLLVRDLCFAYPEQTLSQGGEKENDKTFQLGPLSFDLAPGKRLGIFGAIGSGKSTIFGLLTRLYNPPRGQVFLNGVDILDIPLSTLRQRIGYGLQSVHLFSDSVQDNILLGFPDDDHDSSEQKQMEHAAKQAQIAGEVLHFEKGWETEIGEQGVRLSGGQRQRIGLARLFLRSYHILLLDDVLSAVDRVTEQKLLEEIMQSSNSLIISSHKGSVLRHCDEIIILDQGRQIAKGSFEVLAKTYPDLKKDL